MAALAVKARYTPDTDVTLKSAAKDRNATSLSGKPVTKDDKILVLEIADGGGYELPTPVDDQGMVWTKITGDIYSSASMVIWAWIGTVKTTGNIALSMPPVVNANGDRWRRTVVYVLPSDTNVGNQTVPVVQTASSSTDPSFTLATQAADSLVIGVFLDWNGSTVAATYTGSPTVVWTEPSGSIGSSYVVEKATPAVGNVTLGMATPDNMRATYWGLELRQGGGSPPVGPLPSGMFHVLMRIGLGAASSGGGTPPVDPPDPGVVNRDGSNTGWQPLGVTLNPLTGGTTISAPGTYDLLNVQGRLTIDASNVIVKRFRVNANGDFYGVYVNGQNVLLEDGEILNAITRGLDGGNSAQFIARRLNIHDCSDSVNLKNYCKLLDSFCHDNAGADGEDHYDGVSADGYIGWEITGNTILMTKANNVGGTAAVWIGDSRFAPSAGLLQGNRLGSNGSTIIVSGSGDPANGGLRVLDNVFLGFGPTDGNGIVGLVATLGAPLFSTVQTWVAANNTWSNNKRKDGTVVTP